QRVHRDEKRYGTLPLGDGGIPLGDGGVPLEGPRKIRGGAGVPPGDDAGPLDGPQRPLEGPASKNRRFCKYLNRPGSVSSAWTFRTCTAIWTRHWSSCWRRRFRGIWGWRSDPS